MRAARRVDEDAKSLQLIMVAQGLASVLAFASRLGPRVSISVASHRLLRRRGGPNLGRASAPPLLAHARVIVHRRRWCRRRPGGRDPQRVRDYSGILLHGRHPAEHAALESRSAIGCQPQCRPPRASRPIATASPSRSARSSRRWASRVRLFMTTRKRLIPFVYGATSVGSRRRNCGSPVRLTKNDEEERAPAWSPDGTRIFYVAERRPGLRALHHVRGRHRSDAAHSGAGWLPPDGARKPHGRGLARLQNGSMR